MCADISKKKRVRAGHRASATKIIRRIEDILVADTLDAEKLSQLKLMLSEKLEVLKWLDTVEEESVVEEIDQSSALKEGIYVAKVQIEHTLAPPLPTPVSTSMDSSLPTFVTRAPPTTTRHVKLPRLTIPPFDSELPAWTPFWESYQTAIHNNDDLADNEKFNYLQSFLQQAAPNSILGLALTAANYKLAVAILENCFENKQQIIYIFFVL